MLPRSTDIIRSEQAQTLPGLFFRRADRSPDAIAYYEHGQGAWASFTWAQMSQKVSTFRAALEQATLTPGDRVAILLRNSTNWVAFDIAAMANGLITVPLYTLDSFDNMAFILNNSGARVLLLDTAERWNALADHITSSANLEHIWVASELDHTHIPQDGTRTIAALSRVLAQSGSESAAPRCRSSDTATIIYTSGTTGRPKGVMLSHAAVLWNAEAITEFIPPLPSDVFLSILPLAHGFERTMGYYLPMMAGSRVAYARSVEKLREDLITIRPTVLLAVPRLYERIHKASIEAGRLRKSLIRLTGIIGWRRHEWISGRGPSPAAHERFLWPILERLVARRVLAAFGGRLRVAVSGGAALQIEVSHFLIGLGLPLVEGYGLTEAAPVVTATTLQDSLPGSVGRPLTGLELKVDASGELLVRSPAVMKGYWKDADATARTITLEGWLRTGDTGKIDGGRLFITGRIKDLIVLSTGEKVASAAVEVAIQRDPLFEQVCVIGDGRPSLTAIVVLNRENWTEFARALGLDPGDPNTPSARTALMSRITDLTRSLPPFSQIRSGHFNLHPWEIQSGVLTPTLKIKRRVIEERYSSEIEHMYA